MANNLTANESERQIVWGLMNECKNMLIYINVNIPSPQPSSEISKYIHLTTPL